MANRDVTKCKDLLCESSLHEKKKIELKTVSTAKMVKYPYFRDDADIFFIFIMAVMDEINISSATF